MKYYNVKMTGAEPPQTYQIVLSGPYNNVVSYQKWPKLYKIVTPFPGELTNDGYVKNINTGFYLRVNDVIEIKDNIKKNPSSAKISSSSNVDGSTSKDILTGITVSTERLKKIDTISYVLGTACWIGGFVLAYKRKSGFWGYVGWSMLGSFLGAAAGRAAGYAFTKDK